MDRRASDPCIDNIANAVNATTDYYDWPLLAAGCILSHTLLDALMVQAIYNPDIISFWEALTGSGEQGKCTSSADSDRVSSNQDKSVPVRTSAVAALSPMRLKRSVSEAMFGGSNKNLTTRLNATQKDDHKVRGRMNPLFDGQVLGEEEQIKTSMTATPGLINGESKPSTPRRRHSENQLSNALTPNVADSIESEKDWPKFVCPREMADNSDKVKTNSCREDQNKINSVIQSCGRQRSSFDKVDIPKIFVGKAFSILFYDFFDRDGSIAIALYRLHTDVATSHSRRQGVHKSKGECNQEEPNSSNCTPLPFVVTAPAMDTLLLSTDEVFILKRNDMRD